MLQMSHILSLIGCHSLLTREVADSPTKSNITLKTGSALFQIPTVPIKGTFQKTKQIYFRIFTVF